MNEDLKIFGVVIIAAALCILIPISLVAIFIDTEVSKVDVTVTDIYKDFFGLAIEVEGPKYIQIRGTSEAWFMFLKPGVELRIPDSDKKIYSIQSKDIEIL